jgi:hypothetical protein
MFRVPFGTPDIITDGIVRATEGIGRGWTMGRWSGLSGAGLNG